MFQAIFAQKCKLSEMHPSYDMQKLETNADVVSITMKILPDIEQYAYNGDQ